MENNLKYIAIDGDQQCSSGESSWSEVKEHDGVKICSKPNACTNITCPDNSHCVVNGSAYQCQCDKDWHGYKCLKYKTFPAETWLISIGASTFGIISILWSYQKYSMVKNKRRSVNIGTR
ncbi:all-trans retinoic acid-induced differentiation factor-like isoform X2 [Rhopilema esculentum]